MTQSIRLEPSLDRECQPKAGAGRMNLVIVDARLSRRTMKHVSCSELQHHQLFAFKLVIPAIA